VAATSEGLAALAPGPIRVRMGLHTGSPHQLPRSSWPRERRGALALALGQDTKGDSMQSYCFTLDLKV